MPSLMAGRTARRQRFGGENPQPIRRMHVRFELATFSVFFFFFLHVQCDPCAADGANLCSLPYLAFDGIDSIESSAIGAPPIALDVNICPRLRPSLELASPFF